MVDAGSQLPINVNMKKRKINSDNQQSCDICYQIKCKQCGWVADESSVVKIQNGEMTVCPVCGWKPTPSE